MPVHVLDAADLTGSRTGHRTLVVGQHGRTRVVGSVHVPHDGPADGAGHPDRAWASGRRPTTATARCAGSAGPSPHRGHRLGLATKAPVEREVELVRSL
ncbi:MAG TPA: hypothetical protein VFV40_08490 [Nocardioides sp.]|nr:hypothetical protein [Nocardioides sp.]